MAERNVLALDLGASNGRAILGTFNGNSIGLKELHRFSISPLKILDRTCWNIYALFDEIKKVLKYCSREDIEVDSLSIDSWALDYGILTPGGKLLGLPAHYRDTRTKGVPDKVYTTISADDLFIKNGMIPFEGGTLFQLLADKEEFPSLNGSNSTLQFIPNLLIYFLTGEKTCDHTLASFSHIYNQENGYWDREIISKLELPHVFPEIRESGNLIGRLCSNLQEEVGFEKLKVILGPNHDTAAAIFSIPVEGRDDSVYISCGTWSMMGTWSARLEPSPSERRYGFNHARGYLGENLLIKGITGLWIWQQCLKEMQEEGDVPDYDYLEEYAVCCKKNFYIDVDEKEFGEIGFMRDKVKNYCRRQKCEIPERAGDFYACIMDSLARNYSRTLDQLRDITGRNFSRIHIVGGGAQSRALCSKTAEYTGLEVVAGPYEASAAGNILSQLLALGNVKEGAEVTDLIKKSFDLRFYK